MQTFEEKVLLLEKVDVVSGTPGEPDFVALSNHGLVQVLQDRMLDLDEVFGEMKNSIWNSVLSFEHFAVIAGASRFSIVDGSKLPKWCNFFLLVNLTNLTVVNKKRPLAVEWTHPEGISSV